MKINVDDLINEWVEIADDLGITEVDSIYKPCEYVEARQFGIPRVNLEKRILERLGIEYI